MMKKRVMKNDKGFTLAELLIVVAIIAVLVAVSIPIFTAQLEKSREATDVANFRAAKAAFIVALLDGTITPADAGKNKKFYYHADTGIVNEKAPEHPYGEGTTRNPFETHANTEDGVYPDPYEADADYTGAVIYAEYSISKKKESLKIHWEGSVYHGEEAPYMTLDLEDINEINVPVDPTTETKPTYS